MAILLIDSYDSFTFNLRNLIGQATGSSVCTIHNDSYDLATETQQLDEFISNFEAIVIGPGPGNPTFPSDIGIIPHVLQKTTVPILGICLGFQALCAHHGHLVKYLDDPKHGQIDTVNLLERDPLFESFDASFDCVRYHSIFVELLSDLPTIVPLATTTEGNRDVLMAVRHYKFPHYGVQYHPESICSHEGLRLVSNFWKLARTSNLQLRPHVFDARTDFDNSHVMKRTPLLREPRNLHDSSLKFTTIQCDDFNVVRDCDNLKEIGQEFILLNSASFPGEWSIVGLPITDKTLVITHSTKSEHVVVESKWKSDEIHSVDLPKGDSVWNYLSELMSRKLYNPEEGSVEDLFPFTGGLIGIVSYEQGQYAAKSEKELPDLKMCFIERFVLYNQSDKKAYVVSILKQDTDWLNEMTHFLESVQAKSMKQVPSSVANLFSVPIQVTKPNKASYAKAFEQCEKYLRQGDSYELCLTTQTKLHIPSAVKPWDMYKVLTRNNPSPYSCYMDFGDCRLLSSSPERFLSWDSTKCQLRPIKGTVRKTVEMTLQKATEILKTPKETGENLMIVDLIRHDLYEFLKRVEVSKLMSVEEYHHVFQLVSVIDGYFENTPYSGIDVLSHSLPPGSMTGAPKKRSVELLHHLEEGQPRGLYSGVCGYWSLNNKADWSVVIRSLYNYEKENGKDSNLWRIGAGGAVTVLSTLEGEWEEMMTKLDTALQSFV